MEYHSSTKAPCRCHGPARAVGDMRCWRWRTAGTGPTAAQVFTNYLVFANLYSEFHTTEPGMTPTISSPPSPALGGKPTGTIQRHGIGPSARFVRCRNRPAQHSSISLNREHVIVLRPPKAGSNPRKSTASTSKARFRFHQVPVPQDHEDLRTVSASWKVDFAATASTLCSAMKDLLKSVWSTLPGDEIK
ncbi:hypothetical protein IF2G_09557 [Cordyceps javanica]|nr:hypothetical protein IF2G_09557 [Cordyceps javanica]